VDVKIPHRAEGTLPKPERNEARAKGSADSATALERVTVSVSLMRRFVGRVFKGTQKSPTV